MKVKIKKLFLIAPIEIASSSKEKDEESFSKIKKASIKLAGFIKGITKPKKTEVYCTIGHDPSLKTAVILTSALKVHCLVATPYLDYFTEEDINKLISDSKKEYLVVVAELQYIKYLIEFLGFKD